MLVTEVDDELDERRRLQPQLEIGPLKVLELRREVIRAGRKAAEDDLVARRACFRSPYKRWILCGDDLDNCRRGKIGRRCDPDANRSGCLGAGDRDVPKRAARHESGRPDPQVG